MIKILAGTFGHFDGRRLIPKTAADAPFSLPAERERELVESGMAEYVGGIPEEPAAPAASGVAATPAEFPEVSTEMKLAELKAIAAGIGIPETALKLLRTKADVIAAIRKKQAEQGGEDGDDQDGEQDEDGDRDDDGEDDGQDGGETTGEQPPVLVTPDPV